MAVENKNPGRFQNRDAVAVGDVPLPDHELNLSSEWKRQARILTQLFTNELGLTEEEYTNSLPKFEPQPEDFLGRFDLPVIVETRVSPRRQCELTGIDCPYLKDRETEIIDWSNDPKGYKTPDEPYVIWTQDGRRELNKTAAKLRRELEGAEDVRGGTIFDGLALVILYPEVLEQHVVSLPGSLYQSPWAISYHVPLLSRWKGKVDLHYKTAGYASPTIGQVTCGRS